MRNEKQNTGWMRFSFLLAGIFLLPSLAVPAYAAGEYVAISGKTGNMSLIYGTVAVFSVLMAAAYFLWEKRKEKHFSALYIFVAIANCGYFLQSVSGSLRGALWTNRISYFGSAYLILVMLLIIMDVCQCKPGRRVKFVLGGITTVAFLLAACGDWLGLYYKAVDIIHINGMTRLVKEYGPLHILYPVYLLSYFVMMVAVIHHAAKNKKLASPKYTMFLVITVLLNLGVWAVEQVIDVGFEFLSVSYIVTEVMLLLIYGMLRDYGIVQPSGALVSVQMLTRLHTQSTPAGQLPPDMDQLFRSFVEKAKTLSSAERRILQYYIDGHETADIPDLAFISIHTVKKHNRSIYQKLGVSSRDELMLYIELLRCCGRLGELTEQKSATE